ncbi:MAG: PIG-L family deacetylase [Erythrobacter sp.]
MMGRTAHMIALSALTLASATMAQEQGDEPESVLVALAHPDDELFMAPAIAALAREGHSVRIVHATPGDAGPGVSGMAKGDTLAAVRRGEAQCAGKALGVTEVINLGFGDGQLAAHVRDGSLEKALAAHVAAADTVLTWGPDGGYGHADHRLVSAVISQMVQEAPATNRQTLLYVGIPDGDLPAVPDMAGWAVTDPALLTRKIPYTRADLAAAKAAAMCHATQFPAASREGMMGLFDKTMWQGEVHFRPAF